MITRSVYREDHEIFRATARRFVERECLPRQAEWDAAGCVDRETWRKAGREGLLCTSLPEEYGGGGGDFGHCAVLIEELAAANVSGPGFSLHSDIIAPYILRLGTEEQKRRWLPKCASGECILAIAMSEPGAGSDLKAVRTSAVLSRTTALTRLVPLPSDWGRSAKTGLVAPATVVLFVYHCTLRLCVAGWMPLLVPLRPCASLSLECSFSWL